MLARSITRSYWTAWLGGCNQEHRELADGQSGRQSDSRQITRPWDPCASVDLLLTGLAGLAGLAVLAGLAWQVWLQVACTHPPHILAVGCVGDGNETIRTDSLTDGQRLRERASCILDLAECQKLRVLLPAACCCLQARPAWASTVVCSPQRGACLRFFDNETKRGPRFAAHSCVKCLPPCRQPKRHTYNTGWLSGV